MQAHVFISGAVQGVGFRFFVRNNARSLGLTGWTRNTEDGGVEAVFQSSHSTGSGQASSDQEGKKKIEKMIALCRKGPFLAQVKQIGFEWEEEKEKFSEFEVT